MARAMQKKRRQSRSGGDDDRLRGEDSFIISGCTPVGIFQAVIVNEARADPFAVAFGEALLLSSKSNNNNKSTTNNDNKNVAAGGVVVNEGLEERVMRDMTAVYHYSLCRRYLQIALSTERFHNRLTTQITFTNIKIPDAFGKVMRVIGPDGVFRPQDVKYLAVRELIEALCHVPTSSCTTTDDLLRHLEHINWNWLTVDHGGDLRACRSRTCLHLNYKIRKLVANLCELEGATAYYLGQEAYKVTTEWELAWVEKLVVSEGLRTREQLDAVFASSDGDNDDNDNDNDNSKNTRFRRHVRAVRAITGDDEFDGRDGTAVCARTLRTRIGMLTECCRELEKGFEGIMDFVDFPSYE